MDTQPELSSEVQEYYSNSDASDIATESPLANPQTILPPEISQPAHPKRPTLLESFYYWVMSRS